MVLDYRFTQHTSEIGKYHSAASSNKNMAHDVHI